MENFEIELYINLVKGHECLYNKTDKHYEKVVRKENGWQEIAPSSPEICEKTWKSSLEKFCRERKKIKEKRCGNGAENSSWVWFEDLQFLNNFMQERRKSCTSTTTTTTMNLRDDSCFSQLQQHETFSPEVFHASSRILPNSGGEEDTISDASVVEELNITDIKNNATASSIKSKAKRAVSDVDRAMLTKLENMNKRSTKHGEEIFGELVGLELSKVQNLHKRNAIKKEIMNIIYS